MDDLEILEEALLEACPDAVISKAVGGRAAISFLDGKGECVDLAVLDYNMPDVGGPEVLAYINGQQRFCNMQRVMFSTSDAERYVNVSLSNGASRYFIKPTTKSGLDELVLEMLSLVGGCNG